MSAEVITDARLRENLAEVMDEVCASGSHVIVTRENARSVVVMSYDEFRGWEETVHLLRSPANAERLLGSVAELDAGGGSARGFDELHEPEPGRRRP
jgi:antitoxin YefM